MARKQALENEILSRVRGEFLEMPGLRVTEPQARRLWGLDEPSCSFVLSNLVAARFLCRTQDGAFVRADSSESRRLAGYAPAVAR